MVLKIQVKIAGPLEGDIKGVIKRVIIKYADLISASEIPISTCQQSFI